MQMSLSSLFFKLPLIFIALVYLLNMQISSRLFLFLAIVNACVVINEVLSYDDRPYSLHKIVNFFILIFFILANSMQFALNSKVTSLSIDFDFHDYEVFQLIVFVTTILFNMSYRYFVNRDFKYDVLRTETKNVIARRLLILSTIALCLIFFYYRGNIGLLFVRGLAENMNSIQTSSSSSLLFGKFVRSIPFACCVFALVKKVPKVYVFVLFIEMLVADFPLGLARNAVAMYWLPILIILGRFSNRKYLFILILFLSIFLIFPYLENFRYYNGNVSLETMNMSYLNSMNFDASQEFMALLNYDVVTYGRQLLGVLLFFIPRSVWPTKPVGSGALLANDQNVFGNISMPFFAEGFINFGYVGMIVFVLGMSFFCAFFDNSFWRKGFSLQNSSWSCYYYVLIGAVLFIMRGDLLSSFAYTVGVVVACFFTKKVVFA